MGSRSFLFLAGAAMALAGGVPAWAETSPSAVMNPTDQQFLEQASRANEAEVQLGQLAMRQARAESVREFGRWMESAHATAARQLTALLGGLHVQPPSPTLTAEQTEMKQRLAAQHGAAFDRDYVKMMVEDHQRVIPEFQKEAQSGQNPWLKTFAATLVPSLQDHLAGAQALERDLFERTGHNGVAAGGAPGGGTSAVTAGSGAGAGAAATIGK